ncbi:MAG: class I SAM-dependent methyltransferase [Chloroflexi bacterium]|nr:MAG: class I SAM-dependent methyltransferase [Chloroflexota bacterium]
MIDQDTVAFYDAIAEYYPLFYKDWEVQLEREGLSLRAIFRNKGVKRVLDASCGAGTQAVPLAKLGFDVVAVDPSLGMLRKAQSTATEHDVTGKILFQQADFLRLPEVVQGPFDAVISKGNALPHLLTDDEIERAVRIFYDLLRPGGILVLGMRDFGPFMEMRPRFLPGFIHQDDDSEFITFDIWEWEDGPPTIATQNLYIVTGTDNHYTTIKRHVMFRPLSVDEVQVVLLEAGFTDIKEQPDRWEQVLVAHKPQ